MPGGLIEHGRFLPGHLRPGAVSVLRNSNKRERHMFGNYVKRLRNFETTNKVEKQPLRWVGRMKLVLRRWGSLL